MTNNHLNKKLNNNATKLSGKSTRQLSPNWIDANLIDAKTNIPYWSKSGMEKIKGTLGRISEAKKQNPGIKVIYEFPNGTAAGHFRDWLKTNRNFNNIVEIRVRK